LKSKGKKESIANEEIASELDIQETMITTLAEMLEEKGQLNYQEWERRVQKKLHK
jgi:biotin operon repressor